MAQDVRVIVGAEDRARLAAVVSDRNRSTIYVRTNSRGPRLAGPQLSLRPDGAHQQWREVPPRQLSV